MTWHIFWRLVIAVGAIGMLILLMAIFVRVLAAIFFPRRKP